MLFNLLVVQNNPKGWVIRMNTILNVADNCIDKMGNYPFANEIIGIESSTTANYEVVTWMFSNGNVAQLLFYSPDEAEIISFPSSLVLPLEGVDGYLYTAKEIELFLKQML
jgi:hypothetical protein